MARSPRFDLDFLRYCRRMGWRTPTVLFRSLAGLDKVAGVLTVAFVGVGVDAAWSEYLPWWAPYVAFGILLLYGFLRASYEDLREVEGEREELRQGNEVVADAEDSLRAETKQVSAERDALKEKVARWENRVLLGRALREAYEEGLSCRNSNPSMTQVTDWVSRTYPLIWAAFSDEKKAEDFRKAEFAYLHYKASDPNDTEAQRMIGSCLDYLGKLIGQTESLVGSVKIDPDFDPQDWKS